jgi:hypothetical protein
MVQLGKSERGTNPNKQWLSLLVALGFVPHPNPWQIPRRSPLAGDCCGYYGVSVARKRAPTDPGAAIRSVISAVHGI